MKIYQRINGEEWRRVLVCGDLHGCYTNLMSSLDKAGFDPVQDLLVSVGDLIDRGQEASVPGLDKSAMVPGSTRKP